MAETLVTGMAVNIVILATASSVGTVADAVDAVVIATALDSLISTEAAAFTAILYSKTATMSNSQKDAANALKLILLHVVVEIKQRTVYAWCAYHS